MTRKIIIYILCFLGAFIVFQNYIYAYNTNLKVIVQVKDNEVPVKGLLIQILGVTNVNSVNKFLTNENGQIIFPLVYDSEVDKDVTLLMNGNRVQLTKIKGELKQLDINYSEKGQSITSVSTQNATAAYENQQEIVDTNYKLLSVYIWITFTVFSILLGGRWIYNLMGKDLGSHLKQVKD